MSLFYGDQGNCELVFVSKALLEAATATRFSHTLEYLEQRRGTPNLSLSRFPPELLGCSSEARCPSSAALSVRQCQSGVCFEGCFIEHRRGLAVVGQLSVTVTKHPE